MLEKFDNNFNVYFGDAVLTTYLYFPNRILFHQKSTQWEIHHSHPYYEMFCVTKGECSIIFDTQTVQISEGQAILITPGMEHQTIKAEDGIPNKAYTVFQFSLSPCQGEPINGVRDIYSLFKKRLSLCAGTHRPFPIRPDTMLDINLFQSFPTEMKADDYCYAQTLLYRIYCSLFQQLSVFADSGSLNARKDLSDENRMLLLLDNLVNIQSYTQKEIAAVLGYSVSQTKRQIRKIYGKGLQEIRMEHLLKSVCLLLESNSDISMAQAVREKGG